MKMKAVCLLETVTIYQSAWLKVPEDLKFLFIALYSCVQNTFHFHKYVVCLIMRTHPYASICIE
jgi:hypothetical protein